MTKNLITGGAISLMLWELQKITKELTKTEDEHTLNFRMIIQMRMIIQDNSRFHFYNPILNTTKMGLIRLSVYNSVLNITERNNQFKFTIPQAFHQIDAAKVFIIPPGS